MNCQICGKQEASVQYTHIAGNEKNSLFMCTECMASHTQKRTVRGTTEVASTPSSTMHTELKQLDDSKGAQLSCTRCDTTYGEFRKRGRFGCAACYQAFAGELEQLMKRIHGSVCHKGKPVPQERSASRGKELAALQEELARAVATEAYEQAARLRDRIRMLDRDGSAAPHDSTAADTEGGSR